MRVMEGYKQYLRLRNNIFQKKEIFAKVLQSEKNSPVKSDYVWIPAASFAAVHVYSSVL